MFSDQFFRKLIILVLVFQKYFFQKQLASGFLSVLFLLLLSAKAVCLNKSQVINKIIPLSVKWQLKKKKNRGTVLYS